MIHGDLMCMTDVAQLNQGRFYWVLVRSSAQGPEWQPARFTGIAGHGAGGKWQFIGFNNDVGHHFVEVVEIGAELTDRAADRCRRPIVRRTILLPRRKGPVTLRLE
jgi:hypothetical protein